MAVTSFDPRNPQIQMTSGKVPQILHGYNEGASSQTFKAGQFVYLAAGAVTVSADGDVPVMGIALADATTTSSASAVVEIPVQVLSNDDEVLIQVCTSAGVLEASNTTCTPGKAYDLQTVSTNLHYIDSSDVTNPKFIYLGPVLDGSGAATYWGRFRPYYLENQATGGIA
jgi:hypothetical protein